MALCEGRILREKKKTKEVKGVVGIDIDGYSGRRCTVLFFWLKMLTPLK